MHWCEAPPVGPPTTNCESTQRPARMSYETTGSPSLCEAQAPPSPWKSVLPAAGPYCSSPVDLSKIAKLELFHCTNCVAPTRPFTSGGLLEGTNPAVPVPTPSKPVPLGVGAEYRWPSAV